MTPALKGWTKIILPLRGTSHGVRPLRRNRLLARFTASVFWQGFSFNYSLTRRPIENGITKKLFSCPRRRIPAQVFVEPLDVRSVIKRHLVPARPVSGV